MREYKDKEGNTISLEKWQWEAVYNNGSSLCQFEPVGNSFHNFDEIEQERLSIFRMVSISGIPLNAIIFKKGMKLIHFYRNIHLNVGTKYERRVRLYCYGYEYKGVKVVNVIMPDDSVYTLTGKDVDTTNLLSLHYGRS